MARLRVWSGKASVPSNTRDMPYQVSSEGGCRRPCLLRGSNNNSGPRAMTISLQAPSYPVPLGGQKRNSKQSRCSHGRCGHFYAWAGSRARRTRRTVRVVTVRT
ncbi:hypothetical protein ABEF92_002798 [Exophiala dermatitidis]|uniref:Uncharacterized protein n=1 Tax=Exophiala dermatitidis (strain ATCC 34100 / CBS 525.76 / NIH/UT8656) TaxID=858893 RepID=H6BZF1_EXODN|nr:uncharacterized protein HMPREF1120_05069 [Exophiala dermatitidis NIH/UT8656]EHY57015.1 hypothetical protein HMPREF1120_05069 [Exophiala dermatitidis NIH/UT8656]